MKHVTVVLATFNGERFIEEQLNSIADQTERPAELIISDDGSIDDTLLICEKFRQRAPFPVHISRNTERLGYRENFMKAVQCASSELIAFCDQDDIWMSNKLEVLTQLFTSEEVLLAYSNADIVDQSGGYLARLYTAGPNGLSRPSELGPWFKVPGFAQIFRRDLCRLDNLRTLCLDEADVGERIVAHDRWYCFLASSLGSVTYSDDSLVKYRQHNANVYGWSGANSSARWRSFVHSFKDARRYDRYARAAIGRAAVLNSVRNLRIDEIAAGASELKYLALAECYSERQQCYESGYLWSRLRALTRAVNKGAYEGEWGAGLLPFVKDVFCGALHLDAVLSRLVEG